MLWSRAKWSPPRSFFLLPVLWPKSYDSTETLVVYTVYNTFLITLRVRISEYQCERYKSPGFNTSILRHSESWVHGGRYTIRLMHLQSELHKKFLKEFSEERLFPWIEQWKKSKRKFCLANLPPQIGLERGEVANYKINVVTKSHFHCTAGKTNQFTKIESLTLSKKMKVYKQIWVLIRTMHSAFWSPTHSISSSLIYGDTDTTPLFLLFVL
jgi:hypothetical protein